MIKRSPGSVPTIDLDTADILPYDVPPSLGEMRLSLPECNYLARLVECHIMWTELLDEVYVHLQ